MPFKLRELLRPKESRSRSRSRSPLPEPSPVTDEASLQYSSQAAAPQGTGTQTTIRPAPIGKGENYGVIPLYDGGANPKVDIVFVHGLTGNAYNTWLHEKTSVHWPSALLKQDIPDARILSYGYDADIVNFWNPASNSRLSNHAENMVGDLVRTRERTDTESRKILFVGHSLGGLVVERALSYSRNTAEKHLHQIERCTAGIVFLGVPHYGSDLTKWGSFGTQMVNVLRPTNKDIVRVLQPGSEMLREVQTGFHSILRLRQDENSKISITCFYEELPVFGVGEIVPSHSAEIKGYSFYGIHANHMDMTKFPDREDRGYDAVLGELRRWKKLVERAFKNEPQPDCKPIGPRKVPRATSLLYAGREELGERLAQAFSFDSSTLSTRPRTFVIRGIGGIGKSEVCLKYVEDYGYRYWGVFWLDATTVATAEQGYADIGGLCGIREPNIEAVKSSLAYNSQSWLLIIDNADDPKTDYSKYIPPGKKGDILLTTRNPECEQYQTVGSEILEDLEPELAKKLLLRAASVAKEQWKEKDKAAEAVVNVLGIHTLAIIQAGAFIGRHKLSNLEDYPKIFREQKEQVMKFHSNQNVSTYGNVYATFEVSAKHLLSSELQEDLDALEFLHILAFMHNSGFSEAIFKRAAEYASGIAEGDEISDDEISDDEVLSLSARHVTRLPEYAQQGWSSLRWRKACSILESLSIVTVHEDDGPVTVSAHSLVHAWAKERQDHRSRCLAWQSAATILALSCEGWHSFQPFFRSLLPQVQSCVSYEIEDYTQNMPDMEAAQVLFRFAYFLDSMSEETSLSVLVQGLRLRLEDKHRDDQELAIQMNYFSGRVSYRQGKYKEAVKLFERVSNVRGKLAEDHPDRLVSQHVLAIAYLADGKVDEAIKLLEHVVGIEEKLAEDHPNRLASQHVLARAYLADGKVDKAIHLFEHVVKVEGGKLAKDHPSRLISLRALIRAYRENGQDDKAEELENMLADDSATEPDDTSGEESSMVEDDDEP